ncbi:MAG TPA: hypothetical protein VKK79_10035, partial [Candidatus Lokiarchaeia archaeon]|nr:hypothetical protein [Candidatus Lokiarchaeia archaeon]
FQSKTKYLVTITAIIEGTVSICLYNVQAGSLPFLIFMGVATAGFFIICISAVALFANMAVKSVGSIRVNTAVAAIGVLLFVTGVLADLPETGYVVPLLPDWITGFAAPILIFAGFIIMAVAFARIFSSS